MPREIPRRVPVREGVGPDEFDWPRCGVWDPAFAAPPSRSPPCGERRRAAKARCSEKRAQTRLSPPSGVALSPVFLRLAWGWVQEWVHRRQYAPRWLPPAHPEPPKARSLRRTPRLGIPADHGTTRLLRQNGRELAALDSETACLCPFQSCTKRAQRKSPRFRPSCRIMAKRSPFGRSFLLSFNTVLLLP